MTFPYGDVHIFPVTPVAAAITVVVFLEVAVAFLFNPDHARFGLRDGDLFPVAVLDTIRANHASADEEADDHANEPETECCKAHDPVRLQVKEHAGAGPGKHEERDADRQYGTDVSECEIFTGGKDVVDEFRVIGNR